MTRAFAKKAALLLRILDVLLVAVLAIGGATHAVEAADSIIDPTILAGGPLPEVPVVFVSRQHSTEWAPFAGPPIPFSGREVTWGGRLMLWTPGGAVTTLTDEGVLYDVKEPDVSFDATRVVFSAATEPSGRWFLWEIGLDGTGLQQLTFDDRDIPIPPDPYYPGANEQTFQRYGDFCPAYLPDGRILFSSTRYMTQSPSCGQRGQNLYVLDLASGAIHRRTTERAGALDPLVLSDGRIAFSHWFDFKCFPADDGPGLDLESGLNPSPWLVWVMNPDGSAAGRYAFLHGGLQDGGGAHQFRELPGGDLLVTFRGTRTGQMRHVTLDSAVTRITPSSVDPHDLVFLGNPYEYEAPHALGPAPLPDGRIVLSYTTSATLEWNWARQARADFDFGLYVADPSLETLVPLYDEPGRHEMDAVAVVPRSAPIIPDLPGADLVTDDPTVDLGQTALLANGNVYADLPLEVAELPSPRVGTVARLDVYDDSQTFTTSAEHPLLFLQEPPLVGSFPVAADGSFSAQIPADRPLLFVLVNQDGIAVRSPLSPAQPDGGGESVVTHTFNGYDYLRPNTAAHCRGCHIGHMSRPQLALEAKANLARLATATASSSAHAFYAGAWRANDLRLANPNGSCAWVSLEGPGSWIRFDWPAPVQLEAMILHPLTAIDAQVTAATLTLSDGATITLAEIPLDGAPFTVPFSSAHQVTWACLTVDGGPAERVGIAEIVFQGPPESVAIPDIPPPAPVNLRSGATASELLWDWCGGLRDDPAVAGYRVYYGIAPGGYTGVADVGNVNRVQIHDRWACGTTYYVALRAYNVYGTESELASNEIEVSMVCPVITAVEPDHGPLCGQMPIRIHGENFAPGLSAWMGSMPVQAEYLQVVSSTLIQALSPHSAYFDPGPTEVTVVNPDRQSFTLPDGYLFEDLEPLSVDIACVPATGTVPFDLGISVTLGNNYPSLSRRLGCRIDVTLANGHCYFNWRHGVTTIGPEQSRLFALSQLIPATGAVLGENLFTLVTTDITPPPYNQPPYLPGAGTLEDSCRVTALAP